MDVSLFKVTYKSNLAGCSLMQIITVLLFITHVTIINKYIYLIYNCKSMNVLIMCDIKHIILQTCILLNITASSKRKYYKQLISVS